MEGFYKLFFSNEDITLCKNLFKYFLATIYVVQLDSTLNGKETFRSTIAKDIFDRDIADIFMVDRF